jgi:hypothetical protein
MMDVMDDLLKSFEFWDSNLSNPARALSGLAFWASTRALTGLELIIYVRALPGLTELSVEPRQSPYRVGVLGEHQSPYRVGVNYLRQSPSRVDGTLSRTPPEPFQGWRFGRASEPLQGWCIFQSNPARALSGLAFWAHSRFVDLRRYCSSST